MPLPTWLAVVCSKGTMEQVHVLEGPEGPQEVSAKLQDPYILRCLQALHATGSEALSADPVRSSVPRMVQALQRWLRPTNTSAFVPTVALQVRCSALPCRAVPCRALSPS